MVGHGVFGIFRPLGIEVHIRSRHVECCCWSISCSTAISSCIPTGKAVIGSNHASLSQNCYLYSCVVWRTPINRYCSPRTAITMVGHGVGNRINRNWSPRSWITSIVYIYINLKGARYKCRYGNHIRSNRSNRIPINSGAIS